MKEQHYSVGRYLFVLALLLCFGLARGQSKITGKVVDAKDNSGIPGVNIIIKGTSTGTVTDTDGNYSLNVPDNNAVIVFSFTGYTSQEVTVSGKSVIDINLEPSSKLLSEVVVVGYGTRKKSDLTGSVSQVGTKDFKDQPVTRLEEALQGRASGVLVSKSSGTPGGDIKVRIRGVNSITGNNQPLVVVDGIIGFTMSSVNPNDIESMEVLKDASATAIYGSRGSNGVILITTKKGTDKPRVDLDVFTGISTVPKYIPILGAADFARIENSRRARTGGSPVFTDSDIAALQASGGTDYQRALFRTGKTNNIQVSTSGKSGKVTYYVSGNYMKQDGIVITTGYTRISGRSNISMDINSKLKVGLNMFATRENRHNEVGGAGAGSPILQTLTWDPTTPIRNAQGGYNNYSLMALAHLAYNPIADMETRDLNRIDDKLNTNINLSYKILPSLNFTAVAGFGTTNSTNERYFTTPPLPYAYFNSDKSSGIQLSNILTYEKDFGKHNVKVTGLYEIQQGDYRGNSYSASNFLVPGGFYLAELAAGKQIGNDYSKSAIESFMGRAEYIYNNQFFVTGTVRRDKSSRFRDGNNVGIFPSVALAYNLSTLPFLSNTPVISNLKLRAGWGQVGNQDVAPYSTYPSVNISGGYPFDGSTLTPGSRPDGYGNPDLSWETTTQYNGGVDLGLFSNRVSVTLDVYKKNTTDLLLNVPVPNFAGGGSVYRNVGEVANHGIDLGIAGSVINTKDLRWDANISISKFRNKVVSLDGRSEIQGNFYNADGSGRPLNIIQKGQPLGQFYGETFLGTWKTAEADAALKLGAVPGDSKYLTDSAGNTILKAIGNGTPGFIWGFNNTITYKNFDVNILINGLGHYQIMNVTNGIIVGATGEQRSYMSPSQLNQWTPEHETDIPAGGQNRTASSRYVENGAFGRLSNVAIGYTFKKIKGIQSLKIYASGQNLLLITGFSGYDPESSDDGSSNDQASGVQVGTYPNPRTVTLGLKLGF
ncbi:SusC/RagA family TonB-linked outer membrane protein [Dyadobacter luticola]|uniref:TonB-dependent receptor n=1 Tax=Dyadobacter luticola TaxID=1979387 RepID=A0A5R9L500_9BACT|nr:TonB-dependent receptor [Dyadobacter luticola]TLV03360.1 TonB-dependent receptor [Dyadobacter luticola]